MTGRQEYDRTKDRQRILAKYMINISPLWTKPSGMKKRNCIQSVEDQYLCVGHKYIYRNVCFTIAAPVK
jgi:hypothetical protein